MLITATSGFISDLSEKNGVQVKIIVSKSGNKYRFYLPGKNKIKFTQTRPDKKNDDVLLCIAAAFTKDNSVDGIYGIDGKVFQENNINFGLGGALKIANNKVDFLITRKGKIFDSVFLKKLIAEKASFFQQLYLIVNGQPEVSKSKKTFQCRGIAKLKSGELCVVESETAITLQVFASDLAECGNVNELIYTDMGSWDEGWYRSIDGKINRIGTNCMDTDKQTNWIIFFKN